MNGNTLHLLDLDGTLDDFNILGVINGDDSACPEVAVYLRANAEIVSREITGLSADEILAGIKRFMLQAIYPSREKVENWATFPTAQEGQEKEKICPAVDHYLLTPLALQAYLLDVKAKAGKMAPVTREIDTFLNESGNWVNRIYQHGSSVAMEHACIDDDSAGVIEGMLSRDQLVAIFTNSRPGKAIDMAKRKGFSGRLVENTVKRGSLGIVGDGMKWMVDKSWQVPAPSRFGDILDVSAEFGESAIFDLRRRVFHGKVVELMEQSDASEVFMASDIVGLDLAPLANWSPLNPSVGMRRNSVSSAAEIKLVTERLDGRVGTRLSEIVPG